MKNMETNVLPKLNWCTPLRANGGYTSSSADVSIKLCKKSNTKATALFTFRNKTWVAFDTQYVVWAPYKSRIYFKTVERKAGYKLSKNKTGKNRYMQSTLRDDNAIKVIRDFEGSYAMKYDEFYELYYIEKVSHE